MQKDLVSAFNPNRFGTPGLIGFHSDYIYSFFIQSRDKNAVEHWTKSLKQQFSEPFKLTNGKQIKSGIKVGFTSIGTEQKDSYEIVSNAKSALSQAMKKSNK
jgi:hypothetical protein